MEQENRAKFGSKIGMIAAAAGSAVGLGNIWKFPYMAGQNGGGSFLLIYIMSVIMLGIPVMLAEILVGRSSQKNPVGAYGSLAKNKNWKWVGLMGILCAFLIGGFYYVVAGWSLEYVFQAIINSFEGQDAASLDAMYTNFVSKSYTPIIWTLLVLGINAFIVIKGVEKGIERFSKIMMPLLILIMLILVIRVLLLENAMEGIVFYLTPHFDTVNSEIILSALGQAFFSLSIGMGVMVTYGSYVGKTQNLVKSTSQIVFIDTFIAIIAGFIIFPAVFSLNIDPTGGPKLVFVTLPCVFNQMFGGYLFGLLFFVLLFLAALTSTISIMEVCTAFLVENFKFERKKATLLLTFLTSIICVLCALSLNENFHIYIGELNFFDALDYITSKIFMPVGGILVALFVSFVMDKKRIQNELTNHGTLKQTLAPYILFLLKYFVPLAIFMIFLNELGLFSYFK